MRSCLFVTTLTFLAAVGLLAAQERGRAGRGRPAVPAPIRITIPAFPDGGNIPSKYANTPAGSLSPAIEWSGVPEGTVTLALILRDADVPSLRGPDGTLHWLIFNIPASESGLPEGVPHDEMLADGSVQLKYVEGVPRLAIGKIGYFGPSPPPTPQPVTHHYVFDLYALDAKLDPALNSADGLMKAMSGHVLAKGVYFALYANPTRP
jgi:Raf kinase inhibitor-like YbhB/YbcL family protein